MKGLLITEVLPGGIGEELGLEPGDRLVSINGHLLRDIIDYNFHGDGTELHLEVQPINGDLCELFIERDEDESLGLVFEPPEPERCGNQCVFCFVHQLPRGLRPPLYVKDEDYRLSFLYGNYITMANLTEEDLERIVEQRLSPLYISVHATSEDTRRRLLGNPSVPPLLPMLKRLAGEGICFHTQVVLCPGINDGPELERTVHELADLYPAVLSLAVVPVGLTSHRRNLPALRPVDVDYARALLAEWEPKAEELARRLGEPFLFFADEFYLKADRPFPHLDAYADLPQLENGVGLVPLFLAETKEVLSAAKHLNPVNALLVTGESALPVMQEFSLQLSERTGCTLACHSVSNKLFGPAVTVAGLVSGQDIRDALSGLHADAVLIPDVMIKEGEGVFLDDLGIDELSQSLGMPVLVVESTPWGIYDTLVQLSDEKE